MAPLAADDTFASLAAQVSALDTDTFGLLDSQTSAWDRRALLAIHASAALVCGQFDYLEIGSYLGGSLQVLIRDPRCRAIVSIDSRADVAPDDRGSTAVYEANTAANMIVRLAELPGADLTKLEVLDATIASVAEKIAIRPAYCFIDGEHTYRAVTRDAVSCVNLMHGNGLIAFHDHGIVQAGIRDFVRSAWSDVSGAVAFPGVASPATGGGIFAVELGPPRLLRTLYVRRAIASRWHTAVWTATGSVRSPQPLMWAWSAMPAVDTWLLRLRRILGR